MEWNQKRRCVGFLGHRPDIDVLTKKMPVLKRQHIGGDIQDGLFMRMEKVLQADEDTMFLNPKEIAA